MTKQPVTVNKRKDVRGRIVGYTATIGPIDVDGETPAAATEGALWAVRLALDRLAQGRAIVVWQGHTIVVSPTPYGWDYWIDTFKLEYAITCPNATREGAIDHALYHLAQNDWTHETDDRAYLDTVPEKMRADLAGYFTWQRTYARLKAAGHDDRTIRDIIAGYQTEPTSSAPMEGAHA